MRRLVGFSLRPAVSVPAFFLFGSGTLSGGVDSAGDERPDRDERFLATNPLNTHDERLFSGKQALAFGVDPTDPDGGRPGDSMGVCFLGSGTDVPGGAYEQDLSGTG